MTSRWFCYVEGFPSERVSEKKPFKFAHPFLGHIWNNRCWTCGHPKKAHDR